MTRLLPPTCAGIAQAAALLREGGLVAFGTETVYGLGGRADWPATIAAIYAAKQRPLGNPLICHYPNAAAAAADVLMSPAAERLAAACWPGPLTMVLPRRLGARPHASVGPADTLAVRVPSPSLARQLLLAARVPIAAPSANPSGRISPTTARHVLDGLGGRIDAVLDCGPCAIGLESTVVDLSRPMPLLLRPGGIPQAAIARLLGSLEKAAEPSVRAPGQSTSHYAPFRPLRLNAQDCATDEALLAFGAPIGRPATIFQLSAACNLRSAAARLFDGLRHLDAQRVRGIAAMPIPADGIGAAINDRLWRASQRT